FEYRLGSDRRNNASLGTANLTADQWLCLASSSSEADYEIEHAFANGTKTGSWYRKGGTRFFPLADTEVDRLGNTTVSRDAAGRATSLTLDDRSRIVSVTEPSGLVTTTQFDTPGRHTVREAKSGGTLLQRGEYFFDRFGRLERELQRLPAVNTSGFQDAERCIEYLPNSQVKRQSAFAAACPSVASDSGWTRFKFYDPFGKPGEVIAPDGKSTRFTLYGEQTKVVRAYIETGAAGNPEVHTKFLTDRRGNLARVVENESAIPGHAVRQTIYQYDVGGHLTKTTQSCRENCPAGYTGPQERRFGYDQRGFVKWQELPELGTTDHATVKFERYDALGNLGTRRFEETDPAGPAAFDLDFNYDRAGRPTQVIDRSTGKPVKEYFYATENRTEGAQTDYRAGKLVMAKRWNPIYGLRGESGLGVVVTEILGYWDVAGRLTTRETRSSDGTVFRNQVTYDALGNPSDIEYPTCIYPAACAAALPPRKVRTTYGFGLPTRIEQTGTGAQPFASAIEYFPNGLWSKAVHANGTADFLTLHDAFMPLVGSLRSERNSNTFFTTGTLSFDTAGNVTAAGADTFRYDPSSQLVFAQLAGLGSQAYQYDLFGNLTQLGSRVLKPDPLSNRLTPSNNEWIDYDQNGNLTGYFDTTRWFDSFNQLSGETGPGVFRDMLYTVDDERVMVRDYMTGEEIWSLRGPDNKLLRQAATTTDRTGPWSWKRDQIFRAGSLFAAVLPQGTGQKVQHYHLDHLGSTRRITDGVTGLPIGDEMKHWPYGEVAADNVDGPEPLRFTGHERDYGCAAASCAAQVGLRDDLDYMHARYYSPWLGRFLSTDPAGASPANPKSWNLYSYVQGNPLTLVDPDGRAGKAPEEVTSMGPAGWWVWLEAYSPLGHAVETAGAGLAAVVGTVALGAVDAVIIHPVAVANKEFRMEMLQEAGPGAFPTTRILWGTIGTFVEGLWRGHEVVKLESQLQQVGTELSLVTRRIVSAQTVDERYALEAYYKDRLEKLRAELEEIRRRLRELEEGAEQEEPEERPSG
ncbi:MAG: RHS repeat-associated core domain-containing protein, partial [Thermoanaerobaculia bacterium]|nr:RHS repeat-associated core domain-containing protein [Thermoanaerobaculia bacterium]